MFLNNFKNKQISFTKLIKRARFFFNFFHSSSLLSPNKIFDLMYCLKILIFRMFFFFQIRVSNYNFVHCIRAPAPSGGPKSNERNYNKKEQIIKPSQNTEICSQYLLLSIQTPHIKKHSGFYSFILLPHSSLYTLSNNTRVPLSVTTGNHSQ